MSIKKIGGGNSFLSPLRQLQTERRVDAVQKTPPGMQVQPTAEEEAPPQDKAAREMQARLKADVYEARRRPLVDLQGGREFEPGQPASTPGRMMSPQALQALQVPRRTRLEETEESPEQGNPGQQGGDDGFLASMDDVVLDVDDEGVDDIANDTSTLELFLAAGTLDAEAFQESLNGTATEEDIQEVEEARIEAAGLPLPAEALAIPTESLSMVTVEVAATPPTEPPPEPVAVAEAVVAEPMPPAAAVEAAAEPVAPFETLLAESPAAPPVALVTPSEPVAAPEAVEPPALSLAPAEAPVAEPPPAPMAPAEAPIAASVTPVEPPAAPTVAMESAVAAAEPAEPPRAEPGALPSSPEA